MWWSVDVIVRQKRGPMGGQTNNRGLYTKECGVTGYDKEDCLYKSTQREMGYRMATRQDEPEPELIISVEPQTHWDGFEAGFGRGLPKSRKPSKHPRAPESRRTS